MVTASHNPYQDNGVKIVDPSGEVMEMEWEKHAEKLANASSGQDLISIVQELMGKCHISENKQVQPLIYIGYDTRPTSKPLVHTLKQALEQINANVVDFGLLSTPQLHFLVKLGNENPEQVPSEKQYYEAFSKAFSTLVAPQGSVKQKRDLYVDCAYGVGGLKLQQLIPYVKDFINLHLINVPTNTDVNEHLMLNDQCGAEYAHKSKKVPRNYEHIKAKVSMACFDGDADRIVFFWLNDKNEYVLIDGDKISALAATIFHDLLKKLGLENEISLGVVQTAYANGASTIYIRKTLGRQDSVSFAATGVKHLHHKAKDYDIGVYFESNGHGTVIFSEKCYKVINNLYDELKKQNVTGEKLEDCLRFKGIMDLINPVVGDAISDMLMVEGILSVYNMSLQQWSDFYSDLPSVQTKSKVRDRTIIKTTPDETKVVSPAGIQDKIDAAIKACNDPTARTFIRPSGTEDIVRVYAEAQTQETANKLAHAVLTIIYENLDGLEKPAAL
jgi:phosphoacetylglucosamine mutase